MQAYQPCQSEADRLHQVVFPFSYIFLFLYIQILKYYKKI